jgi:acetyl-CoA carboxylase biotin carboxyl carrier protein
MSEDLPLSPDDVAEIVAILDGGGYDRIDLRTNRFRLRVERGEDGWTQDWDVAGDTEAAAAAPIAAAHADDDTASIRAPLPGTFYRAPQPGAPPFVQVGDAVTADTVIGIIETMKLMNPVHAEAAGVVAEFLADNAAMVAKGQRLVRVT